MSQHSMSFGVGLPNINVVTPIITE